MMDTNRLQKMFLGALVTSIMLFSVACGNAPPQPVPGTYAIDPTFEEFYMRLGGVEMLGPGISPLFSRGGLQYQYTVSSLLVYNPEATPTQRFQLAPIALTWGIEEPAEPEPLQPDVPYINGHKIWEEALAYYNQHGSALLGTPLTGVKYHREKGQYEQYLTNVGFYRLDEDQPGMMRLLPYGAWMCGDICAYPVGDVTHVSSPQPPIDEALRTADEIFIEASARLGMDFTGKALTETYLTADGKYEKIFENVVLFADLQNPTRVSLRPLPEILNVPHDPPVPPLSTPGMYFYPTQGDLGHNIPELFMNYITTHGTMEISGLPISELHPKDNTVSRQCFTNFCLEYHANAPEDLRIRPSELGYEYMDRYYPPGGEQASAQTVGVIALKVWERYQLLPPSQIQEIGVAIFEDGIPLKGVDFQLSLGLPDGSRTEYYLTPTDDSGQSSVLLNPIVAPNGTVVPYYVCVVGLTSRLVCIEESFMIWDSP